MADGTLFSLDEWVRELLLCVCFALTMDATSVPHAMYCADARLSENRLARSLLLQLGLAILRRVNRRRALLLLPTEVDCALALLVSFAPRKERGTWRGRGDALWPGWFLASHESLSSPAGTLSKCDACEPCVRGSPPCSGGMFCRSLDVGQRAARFEKEGRARRRNGARTMLSPPPLCPVRPTSTAAPYFWNSPSPPSVTPLSSSSDVVPWARKSDDVLSERDANWASARAVLGLLDMVDGDVLWEDRVRELGRRVKRATT